MITVPRRLVADTVAREGTAGRRWVDALPQLVTRLCARMDLRVDGPPMHGHCAVVVPVRRDHEPCVLKVSWIDEETVHEGAALRAWDGRGAVRLLAADPEHGALLLERLDPTRSLRDEPIDRACVTAAGLLRQLAVPTPAGVPALADRAAGWAERAPDLWDRAGRVVPRPLLDRAVQAHRELPATGPRLLLHRDLHFDNVLAALPEGLHADTPGGADTPAWRVIDPKPLAGDPHFELLPLLRNRFAEADRPALLRRRLDLLAEVAGLDRQRAREWALARAVDDWLWGLTQDPGDAEFTGIARCIAEWLAG